MKIAILTLFPNLFDPYLTTSIIGRAAKLNQVEFEIIDLRNFGEGRHKLVDDRPYGGGAGMVLRADILASAWNSINQKDRYYTILTSASGMPYNQKKAKQLSTLPNILIICGHYEGVDQRFIDQYVDEEISIGDYILTGGELPALVITDTVVRLLPQVLKKTQSTLEESFSDQLSGFLEYPQYTRPETFEGIKVPQILLSGNHNEVAKWRQNQSEQKTYKNRSDLLKGVS